MLLSNTRLDFSTFSVSLFAFKPVSNIRQFFISYRYFLVPEYFFLLMSRVLVSSAYRKNFKIFEEFFMSFIYNKKRMGPRILPCGHHILFASYQTECHLFLLFGVYFS